MIIAILAALHLAQSPPREPSDAWYRQHLPATIQVTQDVEAKPTSGFERRLRGTLHISHRFKGFTIKKGQTFEMTELLGEGGCRIRFGKKEYELGSCPWLDGFTDRETDIYKPVAPKQ